MRYRLIDHAREQAEERGVSESLIDDTLHSPGQIVDGKRGRKIYQSKILQGSSEALIRLVTEQRRTSVVVVTVYVTTDVDRYWRKDDES